MTGSEIRLVWYIDGASIINMKQNSQSRVHAKFWRVIFMTTRPRDTLLQIKQGEAGVSKVKKAEMKLDGQTTAV